MQVPSRIGMSPAAWEQLITPFDHERERMLADTENLTDAGGFVLCWRRVGSTAPERLLIQPGVADDLPSLLSSLAVELAWPGAPAVHQHTTPVIAVLARVWQVREQADLRLAIYWDEQGAVQCSATLHPRDGMPRPVMPPQEIRKLLDRVAVHPQASETPHGLLLAGNRAMEAGEYETARACYARAVHDLPRHPEAHRNLALALARLDQWEDATIALRQAWELAPQDTELAREYLASETDAGIRAARAQELEQAAAHFLRILRTWPEEPTALVNLGNIRLREGRTREAQAIFQRFLRLHPRHAVAKEVTLALEKLSDA